MANTNHEWPREKTGHPHGKPCPPLVAAPATHPTSPGFGYGDSYGYGYGDSDDGVYAARIH